MNVSAPARNSSVWASSCSIEASRPWLRLTFLPRSALSSLASWLPATQNAVPAATMFMTRRSTPGVSAAGDHVAAEHAAPAGRVAGADRAAGRVALEVIAEFGEELLEFGPAAVHVAHDVERA